MEIIISNSSGVPIYEQIKEQIKAKVVAGELSVGEPLPSIRSSARDLRCSVITTKNAYEALVKEGYANNVPAKGFYVAEVNPELAREEQLAKIEQLMSEVVRIAKMNNIDSQTLVEILNILDKEVE